MSAVSCGIPVKVLSSLNVVTQAVVTGAVPWTNSDKYSLFIFSFPAVLVLRTYALSDKKMSVLIFLGSLGTASLVLEIASYTLLSSLTSFRFIIHLDSNQIHGMPSDENTDSTAVSLTLSYTICKHPPRMTYDLFRCTYHNSHSILKDNPNPF